MNIKIFGIEIERRTDILAFAAFVISVGSLLAQAANFVKGPDILLESSKQILFKSQKYPDGKEYIRLSARMVYLNKGSPGYDDITKMETATVTIGKKSFNLMAQEYIDSSYKDGQFIITKLSDADPVQIKSGSVVTHETYFAPWPGGTDDKNASSNYVTFSDFLNLLKTEKMINVKIEATTYNGDNLETNCRLKTSQFLTHLKSKKWSAPVCLK